MIFWICTGRLLYPDLFIPDKGDFFGMDTKLVVYVLVLYTQLMM